MRKLILLGFLALACGNPREGEDLWKADYQGLPEHSCWRDVVRATVAKFPCTLPETLTQRGLIRWYENLEFDIDGKGKPWQLDGMTNWPVRGSPFFFVRWYPNIFETALIHEIMHYGWDACGLLSFYCDEKGCCHPDDFTEAVKQAYISIGQEIGTCFAPSF